MDKFQKENWEKIARHLEKVGATDNDYYIRAKAITEGKKDPIQLLAPLTELEPPEYGLGTVTMKFAVDIEATA